MKQETINFFIGIFIGILIGLLIAVFVRVHVIEPKEMSIINAMSRKQAYYEEIVREHKKAKYFVRGPMMVVFLDPNVLWDPNHEE